MNDLILNGAFRARPATLDDLEQAVAMFNLCSRELHGADEFTVERYTSEWSDPGINLASDTRVVVRPDEAGEEIVGVVEVWNHAPHVFSWVWGRVHPAFTGQGIGGYLMSWAEERACDLAGRAAEGLQVVMNVGTVGTNERAAHLFRERGFELARQNLTMAIQLNETPPLAHWPEGISLRPVDPVTDGRAIFAAIDEAFSDHWGYVQAPFEEAFGRWQHHWQSDPDHDPSLWIVAFAGEQIAGISLCRPRTAEDPQMGWVGTLGVRRPWRRLGLGLALLHESFAMLHDRGCQRVALGVDAASLTGATRLYEKAGMRPIRRFDLYEKELRPGRVIATKDLAE
jgi:mycothiol synthase